MSHARQVDTTYLQVDCTLKLRNTSNGTWHTKERFSLCLPKEADIAFFFASGVAGQRRNLSCPSWVTHRRMCECAVSSPLFFVHSSREIAGKTHSPWATFEKRPRKKFRSTQPATFVFFAQTAGQAILSMNSLVFTLKNCPKLAFRSLLFADLCAS